MYLLENIDIDLIVKEMINLESGELRYIDNEEQEKPYDPYPSVRQKGLDIRLKPREGFIFVNLNSYKRRKLAQKLVHKLYSISLSQEWLLGKQISYNNNEFNVIFKKVKKVETSIDNPPKDRHIMTVSMGANYFLPDANTIFTWHIIDLYTLISRLFYNKIENDLNDIFSIVCHENTINLTGFHPGFLKNSHLNLNLNVVNITKKLHYHPIFGFWFTLYGYKHTNKIQFEHLTVPGKPIDFKKCHLCRFTIFNKAYSTPSNKYVCEICFNHIATQSEYKQHHHVLYTLQRDSAELNVYKNSDANRAIIEILMATAGGEKFVSKTIEHKGKSYLIVENEEYCCINLPNILSCVGFPRFTDKKVLIMNLEK